MARVRPECSWAEFSLERHRLCDYHKHVGDDGDHHHADELSRSPRCASREKLSKSEYLDFRRIMFDVLGGIVRMGCCLGLLGLMEVPCTT